MDKIRREGIKFAHTIGGILWLLPYVACNSAMFVLIAANTYLWGFEPWDNLLSTSYWRVIRVAYAAGDGMALYWAFSSLFVHLLFVGGASVVSLGLSRPGWLVFAVPGFMASHIARILAYDHMDRAASVLELLGMLILTLCFVESIIMREDVLGVAWLAVALLERYSHLPSAIRGNAHWMRSYELWDEALARTLELEDKKKLTLVGQSIGDAAAAALDGEVDAAEAGMRGTGVTSTANDPVSLAAASCEVPAVSEVPRNPGTVASTPTAQAEAPQAAPRLHRTPVGGVPRSSHGRHRNVRGEEGVDATVTTTTSSSSKRRSDKEISGSLDAELAVAHAHRNPLDEGHVLAVLGQADSLTLPSRRTPPERFGSRGALLRTPTFAVFSP